MQLNNYFLLLSVILLLGNVSLAQNLPQIEILNGSRPWAPTQEIASRQRVVVQFKAYSLRDPEIRYQLWGVKLFTRPSPAGKLQFLRA